MPPLYTYLTMTIGPQAGMNFLLNEAREFRIGRGDECTITLMDPICSRSSRRAFLSGSGMAGA